MAHLQLQGQQEQRAGEKLFQAVQSLETSVRSHQSLLTGEGPSLLATADLVARSHEWTTQLTGRGDESIDRAAMLPGSQKPFRKLGASHGCAPPSLWLTVPQQLAAIWRSTGTSVFCSNASIRATRCAIMQATGSKKWSMPVIWKSRWREKEPQEKMRRSSSTMRANTSRHSTISGGTLVSPYTGLCVFVPVSFRGWSQGHSHRRTFTGLRVFPKALGKMHRIPASFRTNEGP